MQIQPLAGNHISTALHSACTHLDSQDTYIKKLFIIHHPTTTHPQTELAGAQQLTLQLAFGLSEKETTGSTHWHNTSSTITLNSVASQSCVQSPILLTPLTHYQTRRLRFNRFIKFADDMTGMGFISDRDKTNYWCEMRHLALWCSDENLSLNMEKTKEIMIDFRRRHTQNAPLTINGATAERVSNINFQRVQVTTADLWPRRLNSISTSSPN